MDITASGITEAGIKSLVELLVDSWTEASNTISGNSPKSKDFLVDFTSSQENEETISI